MDVQPAPTGNASPVAAESVGRVIWDHDDTFRSGTLSEDGIVWRQDTHEIVMELARRGIVSSICSKNDLACVRAVLQAHGLWDHFVFPSISWEPTGAQLAELVRAVGLRPASVMFIDDNPANLAEARAHLPDMQTAPETFIGRMLGDARFTGKPDPGITRLQQHRRLQEPC